VTESINQIIGQRIRGKRLLLGWTQKELAKRLNISYQQLQKYERGQNNININMIHALSAAINEPIAYFFQELGEQKAIKTANRIEDSPIFLDDEYRDMLGMVRLYKQLTPTMQHQIKELMRAFLNSKT